jgi:hypothetical protein
VIEGHLTLGAQWKCDVAFISLMGVDGIQWEFIEFHGISWEFMGFNRIFVGIYWDVW